MLFVFESNLQQLSIRRMKYNAKSKGVENNVFFVIQMFFFFPFFLLFFSFWQRENLTKLMSKLTLEPVERRWEEKLLKDPLSTS